MKSSGCLRGIEESKVDYPFCLARVSYYATLCLHPSGLRSAGSSASDDDDDDDNNGNDDNDIDPRTGKGMEGSTYAIALELAGVVDRDGVALL